MSGTTPKRLICTCEKTMALDAAAIGAALGEPAPTLCNAACRGEVDRFVGAARDAQALQVACTQEAPLFEDVAEEEGVSAALAFTNIREMAGWTADKGDPAPKIAALLAAETVARRPARLKALESEGVCLVYGDGQTALDFALKLSGRLSVTLLLRQADDILLTGAHGAVPIYQGTVRMTTGYLGAFEVVVDNYAPLSPSSRTEPVFLMPRDGARSQCDIIVDLTGDTPLVTAPDKRDGYLRADPAHPAALAEALFEASDLLGTFEKPIYVENATDICAHSRNQQTGCSKCLDACPAGAITEAGDHVAIEAGICGGCGSCAAVCPTGALDYTFPATPDLIARLQKLIGTYRGAGGADPVMLVHDDRHGGPLISAMARFGRGLPLNVLPLSVFAPTNVGHVALLGALAAGASGVVVLASPQDADELPPLETEIALANAIAGGIGLGAERISLLCEADPDTVEAALWAASPGAPLDERAFASVGGKRDQARIVVNALAQGHDGPDVIALPEGAPYGRVEIDTEGCTLCLACVSVCPADALRDNENQPEVRFVEAACVQCGLCQTSCPENVITLTPQLNLKESALSPEILNQEEPFNCISCGKPFGTKSTIKRISAQLAGKHSMFQTGDQSRLIEMCDDCRIEFQANQADNPFAAAERPRVRTTDDYLNGSNDSDNISGDTHGKPLKADDFLN